MGGREPSDVLVAALAGVLGGFVALWFLDFALVRTEWCTDKSVDCFREWVGATSGWVAAAFAGLTIFFLAAQMHEARKQTAFAIGDAMPTAEMIETDGEFAHVDLQVINWNRRAVVIENVTAAENTRIGGFKYRDVEREALRIMGEDSFDPIRLPGWIDQNAAPPSITIQVMLLHGQGAGKENWQVTRHRVGVDVLIRIVGDRHEHRRLRAESPDHQTV